MAICLTRLTSCWTSCVKLLSDKFDRLQHELDVVSTSLSRWIGWKTSSTKSRRNSRQSQRSWSRPSLRCPDTKVLMLLGRFFAVYSRVLQYNAVNKFRMRKVTRNYRFYLNDMDHHILSHFENVKLLFLP